jgi:hypothetical protein
VRVAEIVADLCPVILDEASIGVAFRANTKTPRLLEVLSPVCLRSRIPGSEDGSWIRLRLLPGSFLRPR